MRLYVWETGGMLKKAKSYICIYIFMYIYIYKHVCINVFVRLRERGGAKESEIVYVYI